MEFGVGRQVGWMVFKEASREGPVAPSGVASLCSCSQFCLDFLFLAAGKKENVVFGLRFVWTAGARSYLWPPFVVVCIEIFC
jgi:hypothetical protein